MKTTTAPTAEMVRDFVLTSEKIDRDCCAFARATTLEVAEHFGVELAVARKACQKAAKLGYVSRAGRVEAGRGYQGRVDGAVGLQLWEISFEGETLCGCPSCAAERAS